MKIQEVNLFVVHADFDLQEQKGTGFMAGPLAGGEAVWRRPIEESGVLPVVSVGLRSMSQPRTSAAEGRGSHYLEPAFQVGVAARAGTAWNLTAMTGPSAQLNSAPNVKAHWNTTFRASLASDFQEIGRTSRGGILRRRGH